MFSVMNQGFPIIFILIFLIIAGVIITAIIGGLKQYSSNNAQPRLIVDAKVVTKRTKVRGEHTSTYYYVTFEFESGDRKEFKMTGNDYGMMVEGDYGKLTFQGTRYLGFERV